MCAIAEVNPQNWLTDVLNRNPINRIDQLLPANWKTLHKEKISLFYKGITEGLLKARGVSPVI
jgi:hypothetical protein